MLLPGVPVLARLVSEVRAQQAERLNRELAGAVPPGSVPLLEGLLVVPAGARVSELERLRTGPSRVSVPEMLRQVQRLDAAGTAPTPKSKTASAPARTPGWAGSPPVASPSTRCGCRPR